MGEGDVAMATVSFISRVVMVSSSSMDKLFEGACASSGKCGGLTPLDRSCKARKKNQRKKCNGGKKNTTRKPSDTQLQNS
jgi:hypothetical protein